MFPVLPWIFTITKSVMIDELRKDKKSKLVDDVDLDKIAAENTEPTLLGETSAILQGLPEMQKNVLQMRYLDDKTFEEIAVSLKTSPANVRQIVSRGIKRLTELMNSGDDE
jgi:RNA polymerase sigma-70 factor (ECF subfamily)